MSAKVWSVTTTTAARSDAVNIARVAVEERLAANAEVTGPALSVFWHAGEFGEGEEWRVTLRTSETARDALAARVLELHPWDNPELLGSPIPWCTDDYGAWLERFTGGSESAS